MEKEYFTHETSCIDKGCALRKHKDYFKEKVKLRVRFSGLNLKLDGDLLKHFYIPDQLFEPADRAGAFYHVICSPSFTL